MRLFLSDDQRNAISMNENRIYLSPIFKWYSEDFEKGQQGFNTINDLIKTYQTAMTNNSEQLKWLQKLDFDVHYLDYDWRLNDISTF